jgi:hypothetical protein
MSDLIELVALRIGVRLSEDPLFVKPDDIPRALELSLSAFNAHTPSTSITFEDTKEIEKIKDILVTYAAYVILMPQAILEKGREWTMKDVNTEMGPPDVGNFLLEITRDLLRHWHEQMLYCKEPGDIY